MEPSKEEMSVRLTLSYDWNRGVDKNPLPYLKDMPGQEHTTIEGSGGGTAEWQYDLELEFDTKEHAETWVKYVTSLASYKAAHGSITTETKF